MTMRNGWLAKTATMMLVMNCATGLVRAGDWPQWGGNDPGRNMVSTETGLPESFQTQGETLENVRWMAPLGGHIYGNPTVANGRVFVGTDDKQLSDDPRFHRTQGGMVWCLDEATGRMLWRLVVPQRTADRLPQGALYGQQHNGTCSSVAVVGKRAFLVTSACEVICLDVNGQADGNDGPFKDEARYMAGEGQPPVELGPRDADIIWVCDMVEQLGVCPHDVASCSPLVDGRILYTETSNGVDKPHKVCLRPDAPSFIAMDTETGRVLATDTEGLGRTMWHCAWSPPSLGVVRGRKLVFFGGPDGICYAFEALKSVPEKPVHFKKIWQYDCVPPNYRQPEGKPFDYYIGDKRKKYSTNKNDGTFLGPSEIISTPVFHDGRVYVTIGQDPAHGRGRGLLHCIDATKTGDITKSGRVWTYDAIERTISSVAIADGLLYAVDLAGRVHCLNVKTGKPYWVYETHAESWASPLVADGKLFVKTSKRLHVFALGKELKPLAEINIGSPSSPIAANGTLFVSSARSLYAVQKGAKLVSPPADPEPAKEPAKKKSSKL
ncbi:MAG: PQQ-binding-like beta-propeller repeat protein [Verrucomicrobia bacterium]|nr:PQQ-binding-like beta-propeller repeat protein [Verrucomicrobiota bacterium]